MADAPTTESWLTNRDYMLHLAQVAGADIGALGKAEEAYGPSWKRRGGVGAFMMLARKWDRIENRLRHDPEGEGPAAWDVFDHIEADDRPEGIIDDIRDLRRYLMLVEAEMIARGVVK